MKLDLTPEQAFFAGLLPGLMTGDQIGSWACAERRPFTDLYFAPVDFSRFQRSALVLLAPGS